MSSGLQIIRSLLIYGITLPLAVFLGYSLANPLDYSTVGLVSLVVLLLLMPLLLRWHQFLLIACWNTSVVVFLLPGQPNLWLLMAVVSLTIAIIQRALNPEQHFLHVSSVTYPLIFIAVVVVITAQLNGGLGFRVLGSGNMGGKRYLMILGAIAGYFAMTSRAIPAQSAKLFSSAFLLGGVTFAVGILVRWVDPAFYFIFLIFPPDENVDLAFGAMGGIARFSGLAFGSIAVAVFLMARYGIRGLFSLAHPWRCALFLAAAVVSLFGGFRSVVVLLALTFACQFYLEGLFRSRLLPLFLLVGALGGACLIPLLPHMPAQFQRALSFLPADIDPSVKLDAEGSSDWRFQMWQEILPEVPQYLLLGKGLGINTADMEMAQIDTKQGFEGGYYGAMLAGDYHNGPLSVVIPFGIWGVIGFLWLLGAAGRLLYRNHCYGDESLRNVNAVLFAFFIAQALMFLFVFGGFYSQLMNFTGLAGISVALNGGMRGPKPVEVEQPEAVSVLARVLPRPMPGRG